MTIAASSATACLRRLESMICVSVPRMLPDYARDMLAENLQVIVQLQKMEDGRRRVTEIVEVHGVQRGKIKTTTVFQLKRSAKGGEEANWEHVAGSVKPRFARNLSRPATAASKPSTAATRQLNGPRFRAE